MAEHFERPSPFDIDPVLIDNTTATPKLMNGLRAPAYSLQANIDTAIRELEAAKENLSAAAFVESLASLLGMQEAAKEIVFRVKQLDITIDVRQR